MAGNDFATEARTLDRLGLAGMDAAQIQETLEQGFRWAKPAAGGT